MALRAPKYFCRAPTWPWSIFHPPHLPSFPLCRKFLSFCASGRLLNQPPAAELRPFLPVAQRPWMSVVHFVCLPKPEQLHGLRARTGKEGI